MAVAIIETNNNLDKVTFVQRVTTYLHHVTRRYNQMNGRERLNNALLDIERYARYNDEDGISLTYNWTAYAVRWSIETLRLSINAEKALEALKVREIVTLIHELHTHCQTQIDVTHYLNQKWS